MRTCNFVAILVFAMMAILWGPQETSAQGEGFITPLQDTSENQEGVLPAGALHQGAQVLHKISPGENLHLLAAYYYGDPRQWGRIYQQNRAILRNPNRLPIGQTLQIPVNENWTPTFSYQEWFRLATRNGEWIPGQWKRAAITSGFAPVPEKKPAPVPTEPPQKPVSEPQEETAPPQEASPPPAEKTETPAVQEQQVDEEQAPAF